MGVTLAERGRKSGKKRAIIATARKLADWPGSVKLETIRSFQCPLRTVKPMMRPGAPI